jgi:2-methylcitrate dehydratase PrpD
MEVGRRTFLKGVGMLAVSSVATANAVLAENTLDGKPGQGESQFAEKPKPIMSGPSQAEGIAKFATRTNYEDLTPERRERLKVSILDSLACAINALGAPPITARQAQAKEFGGSDGRCTLIGGGQANVVYAAQYNTALVRIALGSIHGVFLASRGVTGPKHVIEGPNGLAQALDRSIQVDWDQVKLDCFDRLSLKSYNSAVPTQSAIFCTLQLHQAHPFDPADIVSIEAEVFQDAYDFTGDGRFGPKKNIHTKEDADHSLPYLLAVGLLHGDVQPAQLEPSRISKSDVHNLLQTVTVRPNEGFTARYPAEVPSRVTVRLRSGQVFTHEVSDYPGASNQPFTWKEAVHSLEDIQINDLMKALSQLNS